MLGHDGVDFEIEVKPRATLKPILQDFDNHKWP